MAIPSDILFKIDCQLGEQTFTVGAVPGGNRVVAMMHGGSFEGPRLSGTVASGGDWAVVRADGTLEADVRVVLKTSDDALIYLRYSGVIVEMPKAMAAVKQGRTVGPDEVYFRVAARFETAAPQHAWLNNTLAVGIGSLTTTGVSYEFHAVK
ncbi:MAG: DUF3237 domain-containing protein [Burkholderiales bacterium]